MLAIASGGQAAYLGRGSWRSLLPSPYPVRRPHRRALRVPNSKYLLLYYCWLSKVAPNRAREELTTPNPTVLQADVSMGLQPASFLSSSIQLKLILLINRYSEAISYLYSENTFMTWDAAVIDHLPILLLPQRINVIRSLTFRWNLRLSPSNILRQEPQETDPRLIGCPGIWWAVWKNISAMKNLQTLNVKLNVLDIFWQNIDKETATQLLLPIREVVRPEEFILSLPFPAIHSSLPEDIDRWGDLPCTIRRVSNETEL
jgi:hypothetical protein